MVGQTSLAFSRYLKIYTTNKQPVKVVMDPDVQTLDMDLRNNSTKMKKTIPL